MTSPQCIVVVGGVAAGMSAATRLRRLDESASIIVLERSGYVSFANCGLAYHLGGVIEDREDLLLESPEHLGTRFRLDVRVHHSVTRIDLDARHVRVLHNDVEYQLPFDKLVLASGAKAVPLDIDGGEQALLLRSVEDMDRVASRLDRLDAGAHVAIIGGGYIGLELADNLLARGFAVTMAQRGQHILPNLDTELARIVDARLRDAGVRVVLNARVASIDEQWVHVVDDAPIRADLVIAGVGVIPDSSIAAAAGLEIGVGGGIVVDEFGRTSAEGVFAVGDVAEKRGHLGTPVLVALAGPANRDGRYVADTIAGTPRSSRPVIGTSIVEVLGVAAGSTGMTESAARASGRAVRVIHTHPQSHAAYFPGSHPMALKLVVDAADDSILGFQAVGVAGVDKRIDVVSTAMTAGLRASDLADLELAYAPQFASAKDPLNMLGYIASNMATGLTPTVQWHEVKDLSEGGSTIVDVRTARELADGAIPGAVNIPLDELRSRTDEIAGSQVIVHCQVGQRGHVAASLLRQLGFEAANLDGGYRTWRDGTDATQDARSRETAAR